MRILLVDDHEALRASIRSLLSDRLDCSICGEAADGLDAINLALTLRPDVILMDVSMPRMNGLDASRTLRRELPESLIIILSQNDQSVGQRQALDVGAAAYIPKSRLADDLLPLLDSLPPGKKSPPLSTQSPPSFPRSTWLAGGGAMGRLIAQRDWSSTSLGALETWPQCLRTAVNLMLNSQHPMWIGWGHDMPFLYNDAYISVLSSAKHPRSLGRPACEVWSEIWDICGPLADKVFEKGEATFVDDVRLFMSRGTFLEETYYSFSYSPIHDESGRVAGLFCPSAESSHKILNARRLRTLSELSARALVEKSTHASCASCFNTLAKNPDDVPFAVLYLFDSTASHAVMEQSIGVSDGIVEVSPPQIALVGGPVEPNFWPIQDVASTGQCVELSLESLKSLPLGPAQQLVSRALVLPVTSRGQHRPIGVLIVGVNPARRLDSEYRTFFELVAGQVASAVLNARAAEEDRQRAEALAEIDRAKTAFFNNVSHEFRTPLTLMLGPVEDLLSRSHTDLSPSAKNQLQLVGRNGSRLLRLVNTLLDFSRIEAGRMQASFEPTDLAALTVELASVFRSATERAGLHLHINCGPLLEPVFIDRDMWEKIVLNLLSNAIKFTFEGEIEVSLSRNGANAELRIRDTGVGIPAEELPLLFDRFHRVQNTRSRTHEGSGIGLALVQELVQELVRLHGGSILAESQLGKGATFILCIPFGTAHLPPDRIGTARALASTTVGAAPFVQEALRWLPDAPAEDPRSEVPFDFENVPADRPPLTESDPSASPRPWVLVADDNSDMRQYLLRLLSERYNVRAFPNGQETLDAVRKHPPDLVLTDVMMPHLDGFGLLRELRSDPNTSTIPVILLSARAGEESRVEGIERGADDYLVKPFTARELLARVQTHLDLARVRKQSEESLRQSAAQFETLLNVAPLGVYLLDSDLRFIQLNPTAVAAFGDVPDLRGRSFDEAIHNIWPKPLADRLVRQFLHTLETGEPYFEPELIDIRQDRGRREYYEWQTNRIPRPTGAFGLVCYFRDISRSVLARQAVVESEARLTRALDAGSMAVWELDPRTGAIWRSPQFDLIFGYPSHGPDWIYDSFLDRVLPEDRPETSRRFDAALQNGADLKLDCRVLRSDAAIRWVSLQGRMEMDNQNQSALLKGVLSDITERKRYEERERRILDDAVAANAKFRAVFDQTSVFAGIMSVDGIVIDANRISLDACGYPADEVLGKPFWQSPWWSRSEQSRSKIREATARAAQGVPYREILDYHWADGTPRVMDFSLFPIRDEQDRILFLHPTGVDITDFKRAERNYRDLAESLDAEVHARTRELEQRNVEVLLQSEQLRELSNRLMRAQDDERRRIARELHDSAGQIVAALGMSIASLSRRSHLVSDKPDAALEGIANDAQELVQQLSQEIRTMSYLLHPPLLDETGLREALRWYIDGLQQRSGLDITLDIPDDFGRLPRDTELALFRVVQECLTNVHRHSGSNAAAIHLAHVGRQVRLTVQDKGKGISPDKLRQIQSQGSGVGIRGMRERVRHLQGTLDISSDRDGTIISAVFPAPETEISDAADPPDLRSRATGSG